MALVLNASVEDQQVKVFGNYFVIKAGQIKSFEEKIAHFMIIERADRGLVAMPEEFSDPEYKNTEEGKKILEEKKRAGVDARCKHLKQIIYNNEVSLRQDLEQANIKADPKVFASDGELAAYEELVKYQKKNDDEGAKRAKRLAELQAKLKESN